MGSISGADYSALYGIAPDLRGAVEALNEAMVEARRMIKDRLENSGSDY